MAIWQVSEWDIGQLDATVVSSLHKTYMMRQTSQIQEAIWKLCTLNETYIVISLTCQLHTSLTIDNQLLENFVMVQNFSKCMWWKMTGFMTFNIEGSQRSFISYEPLNVQHNLTPLPKEYVSYRKRIWSQTIVRQICNILKVYLTFQKSISLHYWVSFMSLNTVFNTFN